jgi:hypothetical protein
MVNEKNETFSYERKNQWKVKGTLQKYLLFLFVGFIIHFLHILFFTMIYSSED